jgi:hypothetical protein
LAAAVPVQKKAAHRGFERYHYNYGEALTESVGMAVARQDKLKGLAGLGM